MYDWKHTLNITEEFHKVPETDITEEDIINIRPQFVEKLKNLQNTAFRDDVDFENIVQEAEVMDSQDSFNNVLTLLYDFGDVGNRLWVETMLYI